MGAANLPLLAAVEKRLREELSELQVEVNKDKNSAAILQR
jgi:hypothetical protein